MNDYLLQVTGPAACIPEQKWIIDLLLKRFLGLSFSLEATDNPCFRLELAGRTLELASDFFAAAEKGWLKQESLPHSPLPVYDTSILDLRINLTESRVPVIYGSAGSQIEEGHISLEMDIFGSAFFMLSRYEEAVKKNRDRRNRFPVTAALAYQEGFLDRPIVNEYLEILWASIHYLWPHIKRKKREARTLISVDVDSPYQACTKARSFLRELAVEQYKHKNPVLAYQRMNNLIDIKRGHLGSDEYYAMINWIMDVNEQAGNQVAFYFLADESRYSLDDVGIRDLFRTISSNGHEIGLHAGYHSYKSEEKTCREANNLYRVLNEEGIDNDRIGGRQHYLRWTTPETAINLEAAGVKYDSTLSFAEHPGFRCGTCYEFALYDLVHRSPLKLRERPLIIMECSVIDFNDKSLDYSKQALPSMLSYKSKCNQFSGDFTLLWHNSNLQTIQAKEMYLEIIQ